MKRIVVAIVVAGLMVTVSALVVIAQQSPATGRETLGQALKGASLPLESGLIASSTQGIPLSAKYEIDDGAFQLSVYTVKADANAGDSFMEVIVDYNTGTVAKVETMTDGGDLAAAQAQKAAMAQSTRSLAEATATAVKSNAGYRAVSAFPNLAGGHPVAEVTLVRGDEWKVVTERLD